MIINSNVKFNTVYAEVSAIDFGGIAVPCCMCCADTGGGHGI